MEKNEEIVDDAVLRLHRQQPRWPRARSGTNLPAARTRIRGPIDSSSMGLQIKHGTPLIMFLNSDAVFMEDGTAVPLFCINILHGGAC